MFVTRFAPSPTGWLHLGHALAAWVAWERAREGGGRCLLRMEDIDFTRVKPEYVEGIYEDLRWLGFEWEEPVCFQTQRQEAYAEALSVLQEKGLVYPCFCSRKQIYEDVRQLSQAPHDENGKGVHSTYVGRCRGLSEEEIATHEAVGKVASWRLDARKMMEVYGERLGWQDRRLGAFEEGLDNAGDVVLGRRDIGTSYHLAVVVDDAWQEISLVTRGEDLVSSTVVHRYLQEALELPVPEWEHHGLVRDEEGKRLAKRDEARSLRSLREKGWTPERVFEKLKSVGEG